MAKTPCRTIRQYLMTPHQYACTPQQSARHAQQLLLPDAEVAAALAEHGVQATLQPQHGVGGVGGGRRPKRALLLGGIGTDVMH